MPIWKIIKLVDFYWQAWILAGRLERSRLGNTDGINHFSTRPRKSLNSCVAPTIKWPWVKSGLAEIWINFKCIKTDIVFATTLQRLLASLHVTEQRVNFFWITDCVQILLRLLRWFRIHWLYPQNRGGLPLKRWGCRGCDN